MYVVAWMGGEFVGEWLHVYVWLSSFAVSPETITTVNRLSNRNLKVCLKKKVQNEWTVLKKQFSIFTSIYKTNTESYSRIYDLETTIDLFKS